MDELLGLSLLNSVISALAGMAVLNAARNSRTMIFLGGWLLGSGVGMLMLTLYIIRELGL